VPSFRESSVDEPAAHALIAEYFDMRAETFPMSLGDYHAAFPEPANFTPPAGVFLVVVEDGEDVGCGGVKRLSPVTELVDVRYEVKHLWIQPRMQGRHLGRALLEELERRAREFGAAEVVLDTNASLVAAGNLYRSSGYLEIDPYNDNPNATHWFRKVLQ
jgi:GNAT superfamily N-acetyltransferase